MPLKDSTVIIGIDPGYGRLGFGVIKERGRDWTVLTHGVITTHKDVAFPLRLSEIAADFTSLLDQFQPSILAMEELFFSKNTTTALKVSEVRGVVMLLAEQRGLQIIPVKPNEVKLATTGYGRADKKQVQEMVKTLFTLKEIPKPDDAADALAVAWTSVGKRHFT